MAKLKWTYDNTSDEIELKKDYTKETIWPHILRVYNQQDEWVGDVPLTNNSESALKLNGNLKVGSYQIADWWVPVDYHFNINHTFITFHILQNSKSLPYLHLVSILQRILENDTKYYLYP